MVRGAELIPRKSVVRVHPPLPRSRRQALSSPSRRPAIARRLRARGPSPGAGVASGSGAVQAWTRSAARGPRAGRQVCGERPFIVRLQLLDRQIVRVERPGDGRDGRRRASIRRGSVELGQRDVLLVDGRERPQRWFRRFPEDPGPIVMISRAEYPGMVRMDQMHWRDDGTTGASGPHPGVCRSTGATAEMPSCVGIGSACHQAAVRVTAWTSPTRVVATPSIG